RNTRQTRKRYVGRADRHCSEGRAGRHDGCATCRCPQRRDGMLSAAMIGEQTFEGCRENLAQANKLSRTYAALLEALNRHRGKGQQKVTVEHVHVHADGQALVGVVGTPGGGDRAKSEEQPYAIAYAPAIEMPSPNP